MRAAAASSAAISKWMPADWCSIIRACGPRTRTPLMHRNEKARSQRKKADAAAAGQCRRRVSQGIEAGRARRAGVGGSGVGGAGWQADLAGDETDFGDC